jgi:hypothetical protein
VCLGVLVLSLLELSRRQSRPKGAGNAFATCSPFLKENHNVFSFLQGSSAPFLVFRQPRPAPPAWHGATSCTMRPRSRSRAVLRASIGSFNRLRMWRRRWLLREALPVRTHSIPSRGRGIDPPIPSSNPSQIVSPLLAIWKLRLQKSK